MREREWRRHGESFPIKENDFISKTTSIVFSLHFLFYRAVESREIGTKGCLEKER